MHAEMPTHAESIVAQLRRGSHTLHTIRYPTTDYVKDAFDRDTVASLCVLAALGGAKSYGVLYLNLYSDVLLSCVVGLEVSESHRLYFKKARTTSYISVMTVFVTGLLRKPGAAGTVPLTDAARGIASIFVYACRVS